MSLDIVFIKYGKNYVKKQMIQAKTDRCVIKYEEIDFENKLKNLNDVDRLQMRDVYNFLLSQKHPAGHRALTSKEIILSFDGVISKQSVWKQLERLVSGKFIKVITVNVGKHKVKFYEI